MQIGDLVRNLVPIKWGEELKKEDVVYPGLKETTGVIIKKNNKSKLVLVLSNGEVEWHHMRHVEIMNEIR
jgi:hypothetical protein